MAKKICLLCNREYVGSTCDSCGGLLNVKNSNGYTSPQQTNPPQYDTTINSQPHSSPYQNKSTANSQPLSSPYQNQSTANSPTPNSTKKQQNQKKAILLGVIVFFSLSLIPVIQLIDNSTHKPDYKIEIPSMFIYTEDTFNNPDFPPPPVAVEIDDGINDDANSHEVEQYFDFNEDWYDEGSYEVEDYSAGEYIIVVDGSYICSYSLSEDALDNKYTDSFTFLTVASGDFLTVSGGKFTSVENISPIDGLNTNYTSATYRIGIDLPAGEYSLVPNEDETYGFYKITSSSDPLESTIIDIDNFYETTVIQVNDGEYLTFDDCSIQ